MKKVFCFFIFFILCSCSFSSSNTEKNNSEITAYTNAVKNSEISFDTEQTNTSKYIYNKKSSHMPTTSISSPDNTTCHFGEEIISYKEYDSNTILINDDVNPGMPGKFYIVFNGKKYYPALYRTLFVKNGDKYYEYIGDWHNIPPDNFSGLLRESLLLNDVINHYHPKGNLKYCSAPQNDFETNISEFDGGAIYTFSESQDLIPINNTIMILTSSSPLYSLNDTDFFLYTEVNVQI